MIRSALTNFSLDTLLLIHATRKRLRHRNALFLLGCLIVFWAQAVPVEAADAVTRKIGIDEVLHDSPPTIGTVSWLDRVTLIGSQRDVGSQRNSIVTWRLDDGQQQRIGVGSFPSASPDGKWLVYLDDRRWKLKPLKGGKVISIGSAQPATTVVFRPPQWSRDGRYVAITENFSAYQEPTQAPSAAPPRKLPKQVSVRGANVIDVGKAADARNPAYFFYRARITVVDVQHPNGALTLERDEAVYSSVWGSGHALYFVTLRFAAPVHTALEVLDIQTMKTRVIWRLDGGLMQGMRPVVSPDGSRIAFAVDLDTQRWNDFQSLAVLDLSSGALQRLTRAYYVQSAVWAPDGQALYFVARQGGLFQIYRTDLQGTVTRVSSGERLYSSVELSPDGTLLSYRTEDAYGRHDIRVRPVGAPETEERTIDILSDPTTKFHMGKFEQIQYPTSDGLQIYGYLIYPPDFDPGRKYPLYVDVHGGGPGAPLYLFGPLTARANGMRGPLEWHAWAALGYVVFVPDFRSSGEYGPEVAVARYRDSDFTGIVRDAQDVEEATRWILSKGFVDPKRVAILGHSAGGGRVNYLLTRSRLYAAGVLSDPIGSGPVASILSLTTGENAGVRFEDYSWSGMKSTDGVRFADNPSAYLSGFLFDGYKSKTPTLILVGNPAKGATSPISAEVLFSMLRQYGVPTRMLRYMDDGHNPQSDESARHRFEEVRAWLEKFAPPTTGAHSLAQ